MAKQHPQKLDSTSLVSSLRHPKEAVSDLTFLLHALGKLWIAGTTIDWSGFYAAESRHRVPLPGYPFERQRYWIGSSSSAEPPVVSVPLASRGAEDEVAQGVAANGDSAGTVLEQSRSLPSPNRVPVNGAPLNGRGLEGAEQVPTARDDLESIIEIQLNLMSRQIELLRDQEFDSGPTLSTKPEEAVSVRVTDSFVSTQQVQRQ
jgi:acyl transferase domain-containing protein